MRDWHGREARAETARSLWVDGTHKYGYMGPMKTTLELPDQLFRRIKATAAERGQSLRDFVTEALQEKLSARGSPVGEPEWMQGFGQLKHLHEETIRVQTRIEQEFEVIEPEDQR